MTFFWFSSYLHTIKRNEIKPTNYHRRRVQHVLDRTNLDSSRFFNGDGSPWLSTGGSEFLDLLDNVHTLDNLAEDDVFSIEPTRHNLSSKRNSNEGWYSGDEELGSVGVGTSVGHREETGLGVPQFEVLIGEFLAIDGLSSSTANILTQFPDDCLLVTGEISSLKHEIRDDTVEGAASISLLSVKRHQQGHT